MVIHQCVIKCDHCTHMDRHDHTRGFLQSMTTGRVIKYAEYNIACKVAHTRILKEPPA